MQIELTTDVFWDTDLPSDEQSIAARLWVRESFNIAKNRITDPETYAAADMQSLGCEFENVRGIPVPYHSHLKRGNISIRADRNYMTDGVQFTINLEE